MKRKQISQMTLSELQALPTKRLLARLRRLHQCEEALALSDRDGLEQVASADIEFKDSRQWVVAYDQLKKLLAERDHVPQGVELVSLRHKKARSRRNSEHRIGRQKKR